MLKYKNILVTGGAGFIGSHLVDELILRGYNVRVLDNLFKQIHPTGKLPVYFNKNAEFVKGDVMRASDWTKALKGMDAVFHFASAVGVGQSMYEVAHYVKVNSVGTALLLDHLANNAHSIQKVIVAASMSSYGEGVYMCEKCGKVRPPLRTQAQLDAKDFSVHCPVCNNEVSPIATAETESQHSNSIYAISKKNQEEMVLNIGIAYSIPSVALRFFNVYGSRQSLSNPYNGVAAIFASRIKNGKSPVVNEDGLQSRDFVHVKDVVHANIATLEHASADYQVFNVGSGIPMSIKSVAEILSKLYKSNIMPDITFRTRKLDVRHCFADVSKLEKLVGWKPTIKFEDGVKEVIAWSEKEKAFDKLEYSLKELEKRGLR